jgi:4-hydroxybenzoate polyprenyltransferase
MGRSDFFWNEFVYGGHLGSIGASAIVLTTMVLLKIPVRWEFVLLAYLITQCLYNYNHIKELNIDSLSNSPRVTHLKSYGGFLAFIPGLYGSMFFALLIYFGNKTSILFGGLILVLGLFFTIKGKKLSKLIPGFKSFYTALTWSLMVIFTAIYCSYPTDLSVLLFFIFVFLRILINVSFSDIKDLETDRKEGLITLVMIFKDKQQSLNFLHILNVLSFTPLLLGVFFGVLNTYVLFLLLSFIISFYYIQKAKSKDADITSLTSILADGELYYWPFFIFIGLLLLGY